MQRRDALKNIGLSLGLVATTSTMFSILQSCTGAPEASWTPEFFSREEGNILSKMVDVIIPPTANLPGAEELNVPQFIDKYINEVYSPKKQKQMRAGMKAFIDKLGAEDTGSLLKVKRDEVENIIASSLKADEDKQKEWRKTFRTYKSTDTEVLSENRDALIFGFIRDVRKRTIQGYKISEYIGEKVLVYDPVPGIQQGCISLEEATEGRLWSI